MSSQKLVMGWLGAALAAGLAGGAMGCAGQRAVATAECPRGGESSEFQVKQSPSQLDVRVTARGYDQVKAIQDKAPSLALFLLRGDPNRQEATAPLEVKRLRVDAHPRGALLSYQLKEGADMSAVRERVESQIANWKHEGCPITAQPLALR